jgi:hypothetical protein
MYVSKSHERMKLYSNPRQWKIIERKFLQHAVLKILPVHVSGLGTGDLSEDLPIARVHGL